MLKKDLPCPSTILGPADFGSVICPEITSHGSTPIEVLALFSSPSSVGLSVGWQNYHVLQRQRTEPCVLWQVRQDSEGPVLAQNAH